MSLFLYIAGNVILPIFLVMAFGYLLAKFVSIDLGSLSKLNFYVFIPVYMFYELLIFKPENQEMVETIGFNLLLALFSFLAILGITKALKFEPNLAASATLSVVIFNSANYGIPVMELAFPGGTGVGIQVITITTLNILTYTLGIIVAGGWNEWRKGVKTIVQLPILYALAAALLIRAFDIDVPDALMIPSKWTAAGMLPIALLTLGAQLAKSGISLRKPREVWVTIATRLLLGPAIAFGLLHLMGIHGVLARILFVASAFPTAVVTVLFGIEYDKEPTFAADVVLISTLLSGLTVAGAISLSTVLWPAPAF